MGLYIYTIRAKKIPVLMNGKTIELNPVQYSFKERGSYYRPNGHDARCERTAAILDTSGWPDAIIWGDLVDGASVLSGWPKGRVAFNDGGVHTLSRVGVLRRNPDRSRGAVKWFVEPVAATNQTAS